MRTIMFLGAGAIALALYVLYVDTYALGPRLVSGASPYADVAPMSLSVPTEGRAAYVDPTADPQAPKADAPVSSGR
ncbi:hypothetical protein [Methylocapsa sp. S129]|uniref:hypothetical protein n=1 Tax=Methylocapsa sp. S129 TaxID=1641869 RepID=UPI00131B378A|nr:hypothetical protein [Methylocapsa sp. S129]